MKFSPPIPSCSNENFCFHVGDYSFGFNGQEKEKQVTGADTHTSAEFWMYDSRAGRRWQLDPKPQITLSDYACLGNNPIRMNDILGAKFGDAQSERNARSAEKAADKRISQANKELNKLNRQLNKIEDKIKKIEASSQLDQNEITELTNQKEKLNLSIERQEFFKQEMTNMKAEIAEMRGHEQIFMLHYDENLEFETGETHYDLNSNACVMSFSDIASMADELKAGYQFISGEISFNNEDGQGGELLDVYDERDSFLRSWAMKPTTQRPDLVADDIRPDKILTHTTQDGIQPYLLLPNEKRNLKTHGQITKDAGDIFWEN